MPAPPHLTTAAETNPFVGIFPQRLAAVMGPVRLILGERVEDYRHLLDSVVTMSIPATIPDWLNARAYTDAIWDVMRVQRLRDAFLRRGQIAAIESFLAGRREPRGLKASNIPAARDRLMERFARGEPLAQAKVAGILERHGRTLDEFAATVHFAHSAEFQVIQSALIVAIARQQRALRDLEERGASGSARGGRPRLTTLYGSGFAPRAEAAIGYDPNERLGRRTFDEDDLADSTGEAEDHAGPDLACLDGTAP